MPNVYFSYPSSSGGPIEQAREEQSERPQSGRPKSKSRTASAKRPSSARKGSRKEEDASKIKSHFLSFDEAQELVWTLNPEPWNPKPSPCPCCCMRHLHFVISTPDSLTACTHAFCARMAGEGGVP